VTTARRWAFQSMRLHNSLPTGQDGGTLYASRHMGCQRALTTSLRHDNKSSQVKHENSNQFLFTFLKVKLVFHFPWQNTTQHTPSERHLQCRILADSVLTLQQTFQALGTWKAVVNQPCSTCSSLARPFWPVMSSWQARGTRNAPCVCDL